MPFAGLRSLRIQTDVVRISSANENRACRDGLRSAPCIVAALWFCADGESIVNPIWIRNVGLAATLVVGVATAGSASELSRATSEKIDSETAAESESTVTSRIGDLLRFCTMLCNDEPVAAPLVPSGAICSVSMHLTPESVDLLERQLKDPNALGLFRQAAPQLSQLLPILAAGAPLIRDIKPAVQIVVVRQLVESLPTSSPRPVLPAMAVVFEPNDAREGKSLLLATYWAVIKGANELAERDGTPRLAMKSGRRGEAFIAESYFRDPPPTDDSQELMRYNFTPAIGVAGSHCIVSSSGALCNELVDLMQSRDAAEDLACGPRVRLGVSQVGGLIMDNVKAKSPDPNELAGITKAHADEVTKLLADSLRRLPERSRPIANLLDRLRERRTARWMATDHEL